MNDAYRQLLDLLRRLREAKIRFDLRQSRDDALMVRVNVPGQRWEIEFVDYGDEVQVEVERFVSGGHIDDESALEDLFARHSDADTPSGEETARR
jgi:hypothetical protein